MAAPDPHGNHGRKRLSDFTHDAGAGEEGESRTRTTPDQHIGAGQAAGVVDQIEGEERADKGPMVVPAPPRSTQSSGKMEYCTEAKVAPT